MIPGLGTVLMNAVAERDVPVVQGLLMRPVDVLLAVPSLLLIFLVAAVFSPGAVGLSLLVALFNFPDAARIVRAAAAEAASLPAVEALRMPPTAARATGTSAPPPPESLTSDSQAARDSAEASCTGSPMDSRTLRRSGHRPSGGCVRGVVGGPGPRDPPLLHRGDPAHD